MKIKFIPILSGTLAGIVLLGLIAAFFWPSPDPSPISISSKPEAYGQNRDYLQAPASDAITTLHPQEHDRDDAVPRSEYPLSGLREIQPIDNDGSLSSEVIDYFSLTTDQIEASNEVLAKTRDALNAFELELLEIMKSDSDELVLSLPAFYDGGGRELENALRQSLVEILGDNTGQLLWSLMAELNNSTGDDYWNGFGRVSRLLSFQIDPDTNALEFSSYTPSDEARVWFESEGRLLGSYSKILFPRLSPDESFSALGRSDYLLPLLPNELQAYLLQPGIRNRWLSEQTAPE